MSWFILNTAEYHDICKLRAEYLNETDEKKRYQKELDLREYLWWMKNFIELPDPSALKHCSHVLDVLHYDKRVSYLVKISFDDVLYSFKKEYVLWKNDWWYCRDMDEVHGRRIC